jgi:hypothetical protein
MLLFQMCIQHSVFNLQMLPVVLGEIHAFHQPKRLHHVRHQGDELLRLGQGEPNLNHFMTGVKNQSCLYARTRFRC